MSPRKEQADWMRRLFRFLLLTALAVYMTFYLSGPRISAQQSIAIAQNTEANLKIIENRFLALTSALDWRNIGFNNEPGAADFGLWMLWTPA